MNGKSIYANIETPRELLQMVQHRGLSLDQDDINRAQDIFGNAPIEDLAELANSENSRTADNFYMVLFNIWNWRDATKFYNDHSNKLYQLAKQEAQEARKEAKEAKAEAAQIREQLKAEHENRLQETGERLNKTSELTKAEAENHALKMEIMQLKAKLYDMMTANA